MHVKLFISSNITGKIFEKRMMEVLVEMGIPVNLEIHQTVPRILQGIFYTPALIIDDQIVSSGKVLTKEELTSFFM